MCCIIDGNFICKVAPLTAERGNLRFVLLVDEVPDLPVDDVEEEDGAVSGLAVTVDDHTEGGVATGQEGEGTGLQRNHTNFKTTNFSR